MAFNYTQLWGQSQPIHVRPATAAEVASESLIRIVTPQLVNATMPRPCTWTFNLSLKLTKINVFNNDVDWRVAMQAIFSIGRTQIFADTFAEWSFPTDGATAGLLGVERWVTAVKQSAIVPAENQPYIYEFPAQSIVIQAWADPTTPAGVAGDFELVASAMVCPIIHPEASHVTG